MAVTINYEPSGYPSAHNPMFIELASGNSAETDFKYVFDIYVNSAFVTRQKVFPDPTDDKGYLDISRIVGNYLDVAVNAVTVGSPTPVLLGLGEFYVNFYGIYGEEFSGTPYAANVTGTTYRAFNWSKSRTQRKILNTQGASPVYFKTLEDYKSYFLTNRPQNTKVYDDQPLIITYWTDLALTLKTLKIINETPSSETTIVAGQGFEYPYVMDIGQSYNQDTERFSIKSYTFLDSTVEASILFLPVCQPRYEPVTLMFLNRLGGFDSYTFGLNSVVSVDVERKGFGQNPYVGRSDLIGGGFVRETQKTFAVSYKTKWKLTGDSLTKDEYTWLEELITSPLIYVYIDDPADERFWHPVTISETNYIVKNHLVEKDNFIELNIEFAEPNNVQYR